MITSVYDPKRLRLQVRGHAGYADPGEDLLCAAVSALVNTLAAALERLAEQEPGADCNVRLASGNAALQYIPAESGVTQAKTVMDTICLGLELLAKHYGAYVAYETEKGALDGTGI